MSDQIRRQPFSFRFPWMVNTQTLPRPESAEQRPFEPKPAVPVQRPPFRPAGSAPSQAIVPPKPATATPPSPPLALTPSREPPSPLRRVPSQPPSPPSQRVPSQPESPKTVVSKLPPSPVRGRLGSNVPSPTRTTSQSRLVSTPSSLSRENSKSRAGSTPPSPSVSGSESKVPSQPPSPPQTNPFQPQDLPKSDTPPSSPSQQASSRGDKASTHPSPLGSNAHQPIEVNSHPPSSLHRPYKSTSQPTSPLRSTAQLEEVQTKQSPTHTKDDTPQSESSITSEAPFQPPNKNEVHFAPKNSPEPEKKEEENHKRQPKAKLEGIKEEQRHWKHRDFFGMPSASEKPSKGEKDMPMRISKGGETKTTSISQKENWSSEPNPKSSTTVHREIRDDVSRFVKKLAVQHPQYSGDESQITVITLAGENNGATLHLGVESGKRKSLVQIHRGYRLNQEKNSEVTTDGENSSRENNSNNSKTTEEQENASYVNSNVQSINNSIMSNSSFSAGSPGVHMSFSRWITQSKKSNKETESMEVHRSNSKVSQSQKLTYEPIIRRRCLRGLLLESSDSDPDNSEKPRKHGCRYTCPEKNQGQVNEIEDSPLNKR